MTDKTTTTTIPAGSITAEMVTAGADEVANYYDDGNDLRHREVARFVFQAMQRAAPSPAPAAVPAAQWMPIETAPKDGTDILAIEGNAIYKAAWNADCECWSAFCGQPVVSTPEPTAWMPIPAAPGAQPSQGGSVSEAARRSAIQFWRDDAFNAAASIAERYGQTDVANDIRALSAARASAPAAPEVVEAMTIAKKALEMVIRTRPETDHAPTNIALSAVCRAIDAALRAAGEAANG